MIDLWTAFERLMRLAAPLEAEEVGLEEAVGRAAAGPVSATRAVPGFRRAMMDGYVCHAADLQADASQASRLALTGSVHVGTPPSGAPGSGQAWSITTGGPIPEGADVVIPFEATRREAEAIVVREGSRKSHVAEPDEDVRVGEVLLEAGERVTALSVAALAAVGLRRASVIRRPRVLVLSTGDEVVDLNGSQPDLPLGRVSNVNGPVLIADLRSLGIEASRAGVVRDDPDALAQAFAAALRQPVDVVLTTGGVSVGPHDYVARCWQKLGATTILAGLDVKPGWPVYVGQLDGRWLVGLSGSPAACLTTYHLLIRPLLLRLAGQRHVVRPIVPVRVSTPFRRPADHTRLLWARLSGEAPPYAAALSVDHGAGKLTSIGRSNAIVIVPAGHGPLRQGERLWAVRLDLPEDRADFVAAEAWGDLAVPCICIVGPSGAGKTTAMTGLIRRFKERGIAVLAIKHAAHGFDFDRPGSDSQRMLAAGATAAWVSGPGAVAMGECLSGAELGAADLVRMAVATRSLSGGSPPRLVVLEGFSGSTLPRVEVGPPKAGAAGGGEVLARLAEGFGEADLDRLAEELAARLRLRD